MSSFPWCQVVRVLLRAGCDYNLIKVTQCLQLINNTNSKNWLRNILICSPADNSWFENWSLIAKTENCLEDKWLWSFPGKSIKASQILQNKTSNHKSEPSTGNWFSKGRKIFKTSRNSPHLSEPETKAFPSTNWCLPYKFEF